MLTHTCVLCKTDSIVWDRVAKVYYCRKCDKTIPKKALIN